MGRTDLTPSTVTSGESAALWWMLRNVASHPRLCSNRPGFATACRDEWLKLDADADRPMGERIEALVGFIVGQGGSESSLRSIVTVHRQHVDRVGPDSIARMREFALARRERLSNYNYERRG
jgi:hypothetical protein